jgi:hypothetical protein
MLKNECEKVEKETLKSIEEQLHRKEQIAVDNISIN